MAWEQVKLRDASMNRTPGIRLSPAFQRFFDTACSAAGLLFLAPVLAGIALVIMLDDGLPVFFSSDQSRKKGQALPDLEVQNDALRRQPRERDYGGRRRSHNKGWREASESTSWTNYPSFSMCSKET